MQNSSARLVGFLLALALLLVGPAMAADWAPSAPAPYAAKASQPEQFRVAPGGRSALRVELGEVDPAQIAAIRRANSEQVHKRLQIGIGRPIAGMAGASSRSFQWEGVPGGIAAQWEILSPRAQALRIGLEASALPPSAQVRLAGSDDIDAVYGPFSAADIGAAPSGFWGPVLEGERATVEVFLPYPGSPDDVALRLAWVSHLFASPTEANVESLAKAAGACEVDLVCLSATDAALANVGKAVARMTFVVGGATYLCTGTLLNTTAGPVAPYFYTANHCIDTQSTASTLTTHWFYDRTGCGSGGTSASYVQLGGGATQLYGNATTDISFLRLNATPPPGVFYAGWDASTLALGTPLKAVHHPAGDLKKVSLGSMGGFYAFGGGASDTFTIALWDSTATGVTEGGSSGSGIFTAVGVPATDYQLRGGLYGGPSSCSATGVNLRDYYSRFDRGFAFISQYLDPAVACTYSISPTSASFGPAASPGSFGVIATAGCTWAASSGASWITTGSTGSGNGTVDYSVSANAGAARSGSIFVGGQTFTVSQQAACTYSISPTSANLGPAASSGLFSVIATAGCPWTASTGASWITTGSSGSGNGMVAYSVSANTGASRGGTISVAGQTFAILQQAAVCTYAISPASASFGAAASSGSFSVIATAGCAWTASSADSWITTGSAGSGSGTVSYSVSANAGATRAGTIFVAGVAFSISQQASQVPRVFGISTRGGVLTGENVLIAGFIIGGSAPKTVVVRARGPSLASQGVAGALADPSLTLVPASGAAVANDDWGTDANAPALAASGMAPTDAKESAILATLAPGAYTAIVSGAGGSTGVAIVEVYEMGQPQTPLIGISTRGLVLAGENVLIAGFIIQGSSPQTVVVRARGPSMTSQGVAGALQDPMLTLVPASGPVVVNDDWQAAPNALQLAASGFAPTDARESAILVTLDPGAYTAIVTGVGGTAGVAIVEVYTQ